MLVDCVELTRNEVIHGQSCQEVDLIVVDGIEVSRDKATGAIVTGGGTLRVWTGWSPEDDALTARQFTYRLPR